MHYHAVMITSDSLISAVDRRRVQLAALRGARQPIPYTQVAEDLGVHSALFSRLKAGVMPSEENIGKLASWVGSEEALHCVECEKLTAEADAEKPLDPELVELEKQLEDITTEFVEDDAEESEDEAPEEDGDKTVKAIFAVGKLSQSEDPETQAALNRVRELLAEGAVGVSVSLDVHPDDMEIVAKAEEAWMEDGGEKQIKDFMPKDFLIRQRIRHTAIVDTPAFADARLDLQDDGTVSGFVVFESQYTGDGRLIDFGSIDIDASRTPSPIIWDRHDGDHTGMTVGFLESFERMDAPPSSARPVLDDEAITASIKPMTFPAAYFAQTAPTGPEPLRISAKDKQGYRAVRGLAAPKGICHRSSMQCWTWPGDPDPRHSHFHTGTLIGLDNGSDIRVGALTLGGAHLNPQLAQSGVTASQVGNHRDDANKVFGLVRVWETRYGLMVAGVIPPDVSDSEVTRALACSPSIEFWPEKGKRHLVGLHLVPTPGLPVLASMGSAEIVVTDERIELEEAPDEDISDTPDAEGPIENGDVEGKVDALHEEIHTLVEKIDAIAEAVNAILALTPIDDVEIPEE